MITPDELSGLQVQAGAEPDRVAMLCGWVLSAPASPTEEDLAQLDGLISELCGLVLAVWAGSPLVPVLSPDLTR